MPLSYPIFLEPFFLVSVAAAFLVGAAFGGAAALTFWGRQE